MALARSMTYFTCWPESSSLFNWLLNDLGRLISVINSLKVPYLVTNWHLNFRGKLVSAGDKELANSTCQGGDGRGE